jgi:uncharacterized protein
MPPQRPRKSRPAPGARTAAGDTGFIDCGGGVRVERSVRLRLRDGITLVSDHYYPPGWPDSGPAPTLLVRQPYGRAVATTVVYAQPMWFAAQGYNVVIQDVRGRGDSDGDFYPFRSEAADGARTIEWLARRPECNGRIGMYGFSYQGLTQLLAAAEQPPGLQCISPAQAAGDLYRGWFYHHGALRLASTVGWACQMLKADARKRRLRKASDALELAWQKLPQCFAATPYGRIPELRSRGLPTYFTDWVTRREEGSYWARHDVSGRYDRILCPALHVWGWFDTYLHGSELLFQALCAGAGSEKARENQYLVAGPWTHIPWGQFAGETDFGAGANLDTDGLLLRWFNHWLKDSGEFASEPRVRSFAMGENRWHEMTAWPARGAAVDRWFLHSSGRANSSKGDGVLERRAPDAPEPRDTFVFEPEVPVLAPGPGAAPGQFNQARAALLNNVLIYTSGALTGRVHVCGRPRVTLHATSRTPCADIVAKLVRVTADGRALSVCHGIARSTWLLPRAVGDGAKASTGTSLLPGVIYEWDFELEPTDCVFGVGERLRLEIASSAFPLYDRNPGSTVSPEAATSWDWLQNQQQILHEPAHPSALGLPILP